MNRHYYSINILQQINNGISGACSMNISYNWINRQLDGETSIIVICKNGITGVLPSTTIEDDGPSSTLLHRATKHTNFLCQSDTCGSAPRTTALKETEQILTSRRSQTGKGIRCPMSTYVYSEAKDRNPNKRSNLGVHNCIPSSHCRG